MRPAAAPLVRLCPAYAAAIEEFRAALDRGEDKAAGEAWEHAVAIARAFREGAAFGMDVAAGVRR